MENSEELLVAEVCVSVCRKNKPAESMKAPKASRHNSAPANVRAENMETLEGQERMLKMETTKLV